MAANQYPIFPNVLHNGGGTITTADATASKNHDGTSTSVVLLYTAGSNGSRIDDVKAYPLGTNVASVLRIFINNGSANTTAANNTLEFEAALPAITISEINAQTEVVLRQPNDNRPLNLPAGYKLYGIVGTTVAAGWNVSVKGGDY